MGKTRHTVTVRLDGAHTLHSISAGFHWFQEVAFSQSEKAAMRRRVLIFNCSHERNPIELLQVLNQPLRKQEVGWDAVYFCRAKSERPSAVPKKDATQWLQEAGLPIQSDILGSVVGTEAQSPSWQGTLRILWLHLEKQQQQEYYKDSERVFCLGTIDQVLEREIPFAEETPLEIFVTGSLYLVGSALEAIGWSENEAEGSLRL